MRTRPDWLEADAVIVPLGVDDLVVVIDLDRLVRIARSAAWIVRMHRAVAKSTKFPRRGLIAPPRLAWDELVNDLEGGEPTSDQLDEKR